MQSSSSNQVVISRSRQLSTRTSLFSTFELLPLQVRDVDFVRVVHFSTYQGTGVESRVVLASAPAMPLIVVSIPPASPRRTPRAPQPAARAGTHASATV